MLCETRVDVNCRPLSVVCKKSGFHRIICALSGYFVYLSIEDAKRDNLLNHRRVHHVTGIFHPKKVALPVYAKNALKYK